MVSNQLNVLLADDDNDDCRFFKDILTLYPMQVHLNIINDGKKLIDFLFNEEHQLPDVIFLDLSMPQKTGFECLAEIKENQRLKNIPIIVLSTFYRRDLMYENNIMQLLSSIGAEDFIRKPSDFPALKESIHKVLNRIMKRKEPFLIN